MSFTIEYSREKRKPSFGSTYIIYKDGELFARYWHDHRGDENEIDFLDGTKEYCPLPQRSDFIEGGGPEPLMLTARAVAYLKEKASKHS